ncbi:MAG: 1-deoxy-D-xylulose-5-phosphate synthase [Planctomycetes bacterium]|nr:1-deoxy-D-xylulose-5-phosphate synthase [Planctomycetota bacterium]
MPETPILNTIDSPEDLRKLAAEDLPKLGAEIRALLTEVVSQTGGHLASNLGVVDLTIALHRVFDFSKDYLCFDVGHQCYAHKLLTGRRNQFHTLRQKNGITGFPNPAESTQDRFVTGHACTSISCALGLAIASRLRGEERTAVALIGDGSIGGGLAFEALNHAGLSKENLLVILNDNEMAIAQTVGALSSYLTRIRTEPAYQKARKEMKDILNSIPLIGPQLDRLQDTLVDGIKQLVEAEHVFTDLGFAYYGPIDGHNLPLLTRELENLSKLNHPRILHVITRKGNGFDAAANDPEKFHSAAPFKILPGGETAETDLKRKSYTNVIAKSLLEACEGDDSITAITAAMPSGTGLSPIAKRFPERYIDVGISEEHAVTLAGGLAKGGRKPVVVIYSTFIQRAYDQIFHDICLQPDLGVVFALDRAGLVGADGPTHHGLNDIALLRHLPRMTLMAPRDGEELDQMLTFAINLGGPVALRYPKCNLPAKPLIKEFQPLELGRAEVLREGKDGMVLAYGAMVYPAYEAAEMAAAEGVDLTVVNLRFAKPLDQGEILKRAKKAKVIYTVEDGALAGGVGSAVAEFLADAGAFPKKLVRLGIPDRFIEHASRSELLADLHLDAAGLCQTFLAKKQS